MLTSTERVGRTRIRVAADPDGGRCQVRTATTASDPTVAMLRPVVVHHDAAAARVSLVPEGALLLAGDAIEIDIAVDRGARLDLVEPGGTVAFDMRGARARWDVRIRVGAGAVLTWAGEPFVVAQGADVSRRLEARLDAGATLALSETLVLGRHGERAGRLRQSTVVTVAGLPLLVEDLPLDVTTVPGLLGGNRGLSSVLLAGQEVAEPSAPASHRYDLDAGGHLWRRMGAEVHESTLADVWGTVRQTVG
ncbi:urease accessory protein UreD [Nocardioides pelophilus]|uniref:urease accessory protein UreD n=1 Tax=Nocardioides pelophilus TaxID=2172019 RepID=UPI00160041F7|nr:urease accessory protein UreD [Nocardioides pelophilus]